MLRARMEPLVSAALRWPTLKWLKGASFSRSFSSKGLKIDCEQGSLSDVSKHDSSEQSTRGGEAPQEDNLTRDPHESNAFISKWWSLFSMTQRFERMCANNLENLKVLMLHLFVDLVPSRIHDQEGDLVWHVSVFVR